MRPFFVTFSLPVSLHFRFLPPLIWVLLPPFVPAPESTNVYYSCPAVKAGDSSKSDACESSCSQHTDCPNPLYCCSGSCSKSCVAPQLIPYIELPSNSSRDSCPPPSSIPCMVRDKDDEDVQESSCLNDSSICQADARCCENSCSHGDCLSTADPTPCFTASLVAQTSNSSQEGLLGVYVPRCTTQGLFRFIQCHQHYCWCVDTHSGRPLSDLVAFEMVSLLKCAGKGGGGGLGEEREYVG